MNKLRHSAHPYSHSKSNPLYLHPMKDTFHTITTDYYGEFRDRGSKFLTYAYPVTNEEEWQARLDEVRKQHSKANHHCYAFRLGLDKNNYRANDDGEPSGTAGRPILGQIDSFGLTNVIVIVVRYFGGTKLGTSGLINAYKEGTKEALKDAVIVEKVVADIYQLTFDYALMSDVMNAVKKLALEITEQDFTDVGNVYIAIRQTEVEDTMVKLKAAIAKIHLEEVEDMEEIEGLKIVFVKTR